MKQALQMKVANDFVSTTTQVWNILKASYDGNLDQVKKMVTDCPELLYAQYNYTPPIHFAVREGHLHLVDYLLQQGADSLMALQQGRLMATPAYCRKM